MPLMTIPRCCWDALALIGLLGCAKAEVGYDSTVQGTVTIDGQLAPRGTVVFYPVEGGPTAVGSVAADGSYSLRIGRGNPGDPDNSLIPSGEYVATVSVLGPSNPESAVAEGGPPAAGPRLMADKYADRNTSDLKRTIEKGKNIIVLNLDGPWANPPVEESESAEAGEEDAAEMKQGEESDGTTDEPSGADREPPESAEGVDEKADAPPSSKRNEPEASEPSSPTEQPAEAAEAQPS